MRDLDPVLAVNWLCKSRVVKKDDSKDLNRNSQNITISTSN